MKRTALAQGYFGETHSGKDSGHNDEEKRRGMGSLFERMFLNLVTLDLLAL
jgi:hypothetical protein